jgi:putative pyoverdin transport system ATP-binding/permease protein
MSVLVFLVRRAPRQFALAALAGIVSGACSTALLTLVNRLLQTGDNGTRFAEFIGLLACLLGSSLLSQRLLNRVGQATITDLRLRLVRDILRLPLERYEDLGAARVLANLTADVEAVSVLAPQIPHAIAQLAGLIACLIYLGTLSIYCLLVVVGFIIAGLALHRLIVARSRAFMRHGAQLLDEMYKQFGALTAGLKELKLNAIRRTAFTDTLMDPSIHDQAKVRVKARDATAAAYVFSRVMFLAAAACIPMALTWLGINDPFVVRGSVLAALFMQTPLEVIIAHLTQALSAQVSLERLQRLSGELRKAPSEPMSVDAPPSTWATIELKQASYAYTDRHERGFNVGPLDLTVRPGELLFIIGGNGSGKTTLAKLITGLYRPTTGEILRDGRPVGIEDVEAYRQLFSIVFLDFFLFDRLLGHDATDTDATAKRYLEKLQIGHKVLVQNGRFSTTELSQGQRKRLALLVAYLDDRPIYVFDEWAADQDPEFKSVFYEELLPELRNRGKCVIVITHDDQYFTIADRVIRLRDGRLFALDVRTTPASETRRAQAPVRN